jgi:hypothetical protein
MNSFWPQIIPLIVIITPNMDTFAKAKKIAQAIKKDISGRSGLGDEWDQIDADIQEEIEAKWIDVVQKILNKTNATTPPMPKKVKTEPPIPYFEPVVPVSEKARHINLIVNFILNVYSDVDDPISALDHYLENPRLSKQIVSSLVECSKENSTTYRKLFEPIPGDTFVRSWIKGILDEYS